MLLYAVTIFGSAFLLFQVQPIIAKIILPWFGGSASVWITCLLFFQLVLLLGYFYAHLLIQRLCSKMQTRTHVLLLASSILVLPIFPKDAWKPLGSEDPTFRILGLLGTTVGLPYFVLSTTGPLLQAWYARAGRGAVPYRLFALSNAGSMLGLLSYPVIVEPVLSTRHQAVSWSLMYVGLCVLCATVALRFRSEAPVERVEPQAAPGGNVKLLWVLLAVCASSLLFAITNHLSQNVAAIPFLWVLPLSLYLLSFILCFEGKGWYRRNPFLYLWVIALGGMSYALSPDSVNASLMVLIPLYSAGLFLCCMVCHGELARLKPHPAHLTSFYLMCSAGGAMGGIFVGLLAPHVFRGYFELPIAMTGCAVLVLVTIHRDPSSALYKARWRPAWLALVALTATLIAYLAVEIRKSTLQARVRVRNFYGVLRIIDSETPVLERARRKLVHGTINHGVEFLAPDRRRLPTTYYGPGSGVGLALHEAQQRRGLRVGVIGLGAGTIACYGRPGDRYTFYEINPLVIRLAKTEFRFLQDSAAKVDIVLGDARLSLEREPTRAFDVLAVDAFSGDSIPVHLLTQEAFALYFRHLIELCIIQ